MNKQNHQKNIAVSPAQDALQYFVMPRHAANNRTVAQFLRRFIGPWESSEQLEVFKERLDIMIEKVGLAKGSHVYLEEVTRTDSQVGFTMNNAEAQNKAKRQDGLYEVAGPDNKGKVVFRKTDQRPPREGMTASAFAITDLWANRKQVKAVADLVHGKGFRFVVGITGHMATDAPIVFEHPEYFQHEFTYYAYWNGIPSEQNDRHILESAYVKDANNNELTHSFLVYIKDRDHALRNRLRAINDAKEAQGKKETSIPWGEVQGDPDQIRVLLRHHWLMGTMDDTVSIDFDDPDALKWYINGLKERMKDGVDGFRIDLSEKIPWDAMITIREAIANTVVLYEDYSGATDHLKKHIALTNAVNDLLKKKGKSSVSLPDAYYNSELRKCVTDPERLNNNNVQNHLKWLAGEGVLSAQTSLNHSGNHDEAMPLALLKGNRDAVLAVDTLIHTLGPSLFYIYQTFGWQWMGLDIKRELTYETFMKKALEESSYAKGKEGEDLYGGLRAHHYMLDGYRKLFKAADHPVFHDGNGTVVFEDPGNFVSYARYSTQKKFGREMAIVVINFSGDTKAGTIGINDKEQKLLSLSGNGKERHFVLYDLISERLYVKTRGELIRLEQRLAPWERRIYLVREVPAADAPARKLHNTIDGGK